ncbi:hypothetical protein [Nostoc sp. CMAA1605]|uniref:hypothetical protein n=1 Tax=Nostoc sp. CMAA1605 TaxID=2055159 RepID=UPI001F38B2D5|nr:hypothetical protein [Nostoc sp. CMAA1605]MCF4968769.1 hypothetical protein [Nostoc sp. CMAA1605]
MLNNISNIFSLRQLTIPAVGLVFTLGVVGNPSPYSTDAIAATTPTQTQQTQDSSRTPVSLPSTQTSENLQSQKSTQFNSVNLANNLNTQKAAKESGINQKVNIPVEDGIYLYGQSPQPNQIGQGYVVFQKRQGKLVGALYMPRSEFSCFQGTMNKSGELAMTVTTTPDVGIAPDVATTSRIPTFSGDEPMTYAYSVALQDYHQINAIGADDRRILQMCTQR